MPTKQKRLSSNQSAQIRKAIQELKRRGYGLDLLSTSFPAQRRFIEDTAPLKAALCTRRAGKSMGAGLYLVKTCLENPGVTCLYIALTRDSAQRIMFKDVLKTVNRDYELGITFNHTTLTCSFPNGSILYLIGMDSSPDESDKALGQKFKLVVIDEAASFRNDLREIVYKVLKPAVADYRGTICMIGTPGDNVRSLFYDVTTGAEPGWSVHQWTAFDNPHMAEQWESEIQQMKTNNPDIEQTSYFQQMYLGRWSVSDEARVYKFNRKVNIEYKPLPADLEYILSVDLGYDDDTAFVVAGYNAHSPYLYIVESYKQKRLLINDVATHIMALRERFQPKQIICDSISKQATMELRQRYALPLQTPQKYQKIEFIRLMNADFVTGRIKVWHECHQLMDEYSSIVWDDRSSVPAIHPAAEDHLADAALYAWRVARNYNYEPVVERPGRDTEEGMELWWQEQADKVQASSGIDFDSFLNRDWGYSFE